MASAIKSAAIELGLKRYFTGKPCKHGHVCERWTHNSSCVQCCNANARRWAKTNHVRTAANARKWRKENPEKAKINSDTSNAKYFSKEENKIRNRERGRIRYALKRDVLLAQSKARRLRDKAKIKIRQRTWYENNKERAFALVRNRKARKRTASGSHTGRDIAEIFRLQKGLCAYCRGNLTRLGKHVDHIIPLVLGGANDRRNIQILCPTCNLSKGPKHPLEFGRTLGRLL